VTIFRLLAKYLNDLSLNRTLQALADPTRREILSLLNARDMTAGEIAANFEMSLPSVSHHLSTLKSAELVAAERKGQTIVYSINTTVMQEALQSVMSMLQTGKKKEEKKR